jgi:hypothetical protein
MDKRIVAKDQEKCLKNQPVWFAALALNGATDCCENTPTPLTTPFPVEKTITFLLYPF